MVMYSGSSWVFFAENSGDVTAKHYILLSLWTFWLWGINTRSHIGLRLEPFTDARRENVNLSSLLFISLTPAAIHGGDLHRRVFICCNVDCRLELEGNVLYFMHIMLQRVGRNRRKRARVGGECWVEWLIQTHRHTLNLFTDKVLVLFMWCLVLFANFPPHSLNHSEISLGLSIRGNIGDTVKCVTKELFWTFYCRLLTYYKSPNKDKKQQQCISLSLKTFLTSLLYLRLFLFIFKEKKGHEYIYCSFLNKMGINTY